MDLNRLYEINASILRLARAAPEDEQSFGETQESLDHGDALKKIAMTKEEIIYLGSIEVFEDMKDHAPEWLDYLGIDSAEEIMKRWREGTWIMPDYKRKRPPSTSPE